MFEAQIRLVLMVKKRLPSEDFTQAVEDAKALKIDDLMKGNLLKCEVCDWGLYLATVEHEGQYNTD